MATIEKTSSLGNGMGFTFQYDDVAMLLTKIVVSNQSQRDLFIEVTSPKVFSKIFSPGTVVEYKIPPSKSPNWSWREVVDSDYGVIQKISGIEWRACPLEGN